MTVGGKVPSDGLNKMLQQGCVLHSRRRFETAVQVDARPLRMVQPAERRQAVGPDAAAQQEGRGALVEVEQLPVEGAPRAAVPRAGRIKQQVVAAVGVGVRLVYVVGCEQAQGLHHPEAPLAQTVAEVGRFGAVQLNTLQFPGFGLPENLVERGVDKHSPAHGPKRQPRGCAGHVARRARVGYHAHPVGAALLFYGANVVGVAHPAYFDNHGCDRSFCS